MAVFNSGVVQYYSLHLRMSDGFKTARENTRLHSPEAVIGLSAAITHIFVKESPDKYKLVERKDFGYAFLLVIAAWGFTKGFLYFAW